MDNFLNSIQDKFKILNSNVEYFLNEEFTFVLSELRKNFENNGSESLDFFIDKIKYIDNLKSYLLSNPINEITFEKNEPKSQNLLEFDDAISVSNTVTNKANKPKYSPKSIPKDTYYFYDFPSNYAEISDLLPLNFKITPISEFNNISNKIIGLKLFDNIFFAPSLNESINKMMLFLFGLNEEPFVTICQKDSTFFANSKDKLKKPTKLKENICYFESQTDKNESIELISFFLNHINVSPNSCKVITKTSSNKKGETFITTIM